MEASFWFQDLLRYPVGRQLGGHESQHQNYFNLALLLWIKTVWLMSSGTWVSGKHGRREHWLGITVRSNRMAKSIPAWARMQERWVRMRGSLPHIGAGGPVVGCAVRNGLKRRRVIGRTVGITVGIVGITTCKRRTVSINKQWQEHPSKRKTECTVPIEAEKSRRS